LLADYEHSCLDQQVGDTARRRADNGWSNTLSLGYFGPPRHRYVTATA